jgi:hypothetical protein
MTGAQLRFTPHEGFPLQLFSLVYRDGASGLNK